MSNTEAITVTIGRNIGPSPMPMERWEAFIRDVRESVAMNVAELWVDAEYSGLWEGRTEDAWVFYGPLAESHSDLDYADLRYRLRTVAEHYRQDAIGLTRGLSELVESYEALSYDPSTDTLSKA